MKDDVAVLLDYVGSWGGHGIDNEDRPFHGELLIEPLPDDKGVALTYTATGIDGVVLHHERSWIGCDLVGQIAMWSFFTNGRGMVRLGRSFGAPAAGAERTLVFAWAGDSEVYEAALDLWPNGELTYRQAWGEDDARPARSVRLSSTTTGDTGDDSRAR